MEARSARERLNAIIIRLEQAKKLPAKQKKLARKELAEFADRELAACPRSELDEIPDQEFIYVFTRISELLQEIGIVSDCRWRERS